MGLILVLILVLVLGLRLGLILDSGSVLGPVSLLSFSVLKSVLISMLISVLISVFVSVSLYVEYKFESCLMKFVLPVLVQPYLIVCSSVFSGFVSGLLFSSIS